MRARPGESAAVIQTLLLSPFVLQQTRGTNLSHDLSLSSRSIVFICKDEGTYLVNTLTGTTQAFKNAITDFRMFVPPMEQAFSIHSLASLVLVSSPIPLHTLRVAHDLLRLVELLQVLLLLVRQCLPPDIASLFQPLDRTESYNGTADPLVDPR